MSTRRKWSLAIVAGVVAALVASAALLHEPLALRFFLWRYRTAPDSFDAALPQLCAFGPRGRDAALAAFAEHGAEKDVQSFRLAIFASLRCLRYYAVAKTLGASAVDVCDADLPVDGEALRAMAAAYAQEDSPQLRDRMLRLAHELDFQTWDALFAALLETGRPFPLGALMPSYAPRSAPQRDAWCRTVAPALRNAVATGRADLLGDERLLAAADALLESNCDPRLDLQAMTTRILAGDQAFLASGRPCNDASPECARAYSEWSWHHSQPLHSLFSIEKHLAEQPQQAAAVYEKLLGLPASCPWSAQLWRSLHTRQDLESRELPQVPPELLPLALAFLHRLAQDCRLPLCEEGEDALSCERQIASELTR
jgi:hypothetical protein